jgi:O-methyltransferase
MVEAGCWQGGSSAKFSILCKVLGLKLHVYDSFLGVPEMGDDELEHDFSGQYAADEDVLKETLTKYGEPDVCEVHKGWFRDTLAERPLAFPVRAAYIDCDTAQGTLEVLRGVMPSLVPDGIVFSQDAHLPMVRELLADPDTWRRFGKNSPLVKRPCTKLAVFRFSGDPGERTRPNPGGKRRVV